MSSPFLPVEPSPDFWDAVQELLNAGRWTDAAVTVRAVAQQAAQIEWRLTLGTLLYERGQRHLAVREWTDVLEAAQADGDWPVAAAAHHNLAAMYRDLGDYTLARTFQQRALSLQADCGCEELLQLGNDAVAAERWELARSLYQSAAELAEEGSDLLTDLMATRGVLSGFEGEPLAGLRWLQQAYREHVDAGDELHAGKDLCNAAALFEQLSRLGWARHCLEQARDHFEAVGDANWVQTVSQGLMRLEGLRRVAEYNPSWN
jgi:tetratricopeptide (TPR) repeat protein